MEASDMRSPNCSNTATYVSPQRGANPRTRMTINRSRTGCQTCRSRKVKCDEKKPVCSSCAKGERNCNWSGLKRRARGFRRPNATACDFCKEKKLKCVGDIQRSCEKCQSMGVECVRSQFEAELESLSAYQPVLDHEVTTPTHLHLHGSNANTSDSQSFQVADDTSGIPLTDSSSKSQLNLLSDLPTSQELHGLIDLYFESVHHFGFLSFIHQLHFNRLLVDGKAPRELTLIMIASAMRFAGPVSEQNFAKADAWADASIGILLPRIYQGFGALQLMTLLIAQHYDVNRGKFTSAWLLGANCTRMMQMMSLHSFDRTFSAGISSNLHLSPLVSCEALRRLAWSTFYADSITDGGRYGFHTIDENSFRLQLPCDQASFLGNERVTTEPLFPCPNDSQNIASKNTYHASLDMSAYLLRTAAARRRALHFAFRASHEEGAIETMTAELSTLEADIESVIKGLPKRFHFNTDNVCIHRDRLTMFILMHILRHNLFIALGRAALLIHQRDPARSDLMIQVRRKRILHALPIAGLVSEGLRAGIAFDPHIGVHAYVALEILLFEPRRLAETDSHVKLKAPEITEAIPHLLMVIRELASRSDIMNHLHIEAVHRLLRCDYKHLVNQTDINAFRSEYRIVGQDAAEYDFRDFRWARLERILRGAQPSANYNGDEVLLEYRTGAEAVVPSTAPSPQLDAMDVNSSLSSSCTATHPPESDVWSTPALQYVNESGTDQHLVSDWGAGDSEAQRYPHSDLSLDWPWLLEESGHLGYQTGDPTIFWSQLERI